MKDAPKLATFEELGAEMRVQSDAMANPDRICRRCATKWHSSGWCFYDLCPQCFYDWEEFRRKVGKNPLSCTDWIANNPRTS